MKNCVLWLSSEIADQKIFSGLGADITVIRFDGMEELDPRESKLNAFCVEKTFFKVYPDFFSVVKPEPGSLLIWEGGPAGRYLEPALQEKYLFQELAGVTGRELSVCLKNLFRGLWLHGRLEKTRTELKASESRNRELLQVGIALSAERDNDKLLQLILTITRRITRADAGSLYRVIKSEVTGKKKLLFKIAQNDSNPTDYTEFEMPLNKKSISGWVASTGEILNIRDVYQIPADREYTFNHNYDRETNYRTVSMLTVPMVNHKDEIIGVIQLINHKKTGVRNLKQAEDFQKLVAPFTKKNEQIVQSLASQAGVSLENNMLYQEIETLFEGFVTASVKAIESRDPTTSGHSYRVAEYTVDLAKAVNNIGSGDYKSVSFSREQIKEIRYASLLHDFGKVGVREQVLVKAKKLYPSQLELIRSRCNFIIQSLQLELTQRKYEYLLQGKNSPRDMEDLDQEFSARIKQVRSYLDTILQANEPALLAEEPGQVLDLIKEFTFLDLDNKLHQLLSEDEYQKLKIRRGSLDDQERLEIESHVTHTYRFLSTIPWTTGMKHIPEIAYGHHEKLNGEGYPRRIKSQQIPLQSKIMTISDIFDALTAQDRPYKRAVSMDKALQILSYEVQDLHVDGELLKIFIEAKICHRLEELLHQN